MEEDHDAVKRKRRDAIGPPSKREKLNSIQAGDSQSFHQPSKANAEDVRCVVKEIFQAYKALSNGDAPASAPFNILLQASAGDLGSQRLAARLLPRFINKVPDLVESTAFALIRLHSQQQASEDDSVNQLAGQTRGDALHGLTAVLKAAKACRAPGEAAVRIVLDYLFRLLPQAAAADEPSEPEEEGEVAACDATTASMHFLRKLLSEALHLHPAITMDHCAACLAAACRPGSSSSSSRGCPEPGVQAGVRLWLQEHLLKERSPSRESTPLVDGLAATAGAATAAAAGDGAAPGARQSLVLPPRGCLLQTVLDTSEELQAWVMQQARSRAAAPLEVRSIIETALQLLPEDKQLAAAKPRIDHGTAGTAASGGGDSQQQQQQCLRTSSSLPQYRQQPLNGGGCMNGVGPLGRSSSTPTHIDRDRSRAGHVRPSVQAAGPQLRSQVPLVAGPICVAEACLLVLHLPQHISQQEVQQALGAEEAWLLREPGDRNTACCTFKGVLDAAKCYLRHHGVQRLGPHCPAFSLAFADRFPASSKAADPAHQPSSYVWATREAVGDAESITDELRAAGMQLSHVHRVNNAAEPGTLLQTPSAAQAAAVVRYLLKKHPQPQQQPAAEQPEEQELPPLPPEPPPAGDWPASRQQQQQPHGGMPPLPAGLPPNLQQQQQMDRVASTVVGQPISPALQQQQRQQQQQQVYTDAGGTGGRRLTASPSTCARAAAAGSGWRGSPGDWPVPHAGRLGQQHVPSPGVPPPAPPPLPTVQQATGNAGMAAGSSGWHPAQQQQGRWGPRGPFHGGAAAAAASPLPPPAPHPSTLPPLAGPLGTPHMAAAAFPGQVSAHVLHAQQQHRQAALQFSPASASPHVIGHTASSANSPVAVHGQQQQQLQHPGPSDLRGSAQGRVLWQGAIVKQSVHLCGVVCVPSVAVQGHHHMAGVAPEPRCWPEHLHVNFRISVTDAVEQYAHTPPAQRAIRLLLPLDPGSGDTQQLQQFIDYLNGKERAGMVKLPAVREAGLGPRAVYLIVPKLQVCQQLQVSWDGRDAMLIAVVVPQPGTAAGVHGGAAGASRQYRAAPH